MALNVFENVLTLYGRVHWPRLRHALSLLLLLPGSYFTGRRQRDQNNTNGNKDRFGRCDRRRRADTRSSTRKPNAGLCSRVIIHPRLLSPLSGKKTVRFYRRTRYGPHAIVFRAGDNHTITRENKEIVIAVDRGTLYSVPAL